jgi:Gpi18-like mannosyltransferase
MNRVRSSASTEDIRRPSWQRALVLTLFLRLAYSVFAAVVALIQPVNWRLVHSNALTENLPQPDHSLRYLAFGVWERFDTLWYLHIAAHGYDRPDAVVFYPLYPGLVKIVSLLIPPMAAALLISTAAAFFLFWGLQELLLGDQPQNLADQSVFLCAAWPASFIFFAGYPESLLLALIVWSLCMGRRDCWLAAAALGLAAALTKAVGVVVVVPLIITTIRHRKATALPVLLVPLGSAGFLGYLHWTGHVAPASAYAQYWRTTPAPPWTTLWVSVHTLAHTHDSILMLNLIFLISVCALAALSRLRIEYLLYSAAAVILLLCKETTPPLQSMVRYLLIIFPAFAGLARWLEGPGVRSRFGIVGGSLFAINIGLLWLFLGWFLVL